MDMADVLNKMFSNKLKTLTDYQQYELLIHQQMKMDGLNEFEQFFVIHTLNASITEVMSKIGNKDFVEEIKRIGKENNNDGE